MMSARKTALAALLAVFIAGCAEKQAKTVPPAQAQAPTIDAGKAGAMYPPPLTTAPPQPEQPEPTPPPVVAKVEPTPAPPPPPLPTTKATSKRKPKPSAAKPATPGTPATAPTADTAETTPSSQAPAVSPAPAETAPTVATNGEPAPASPIGQLSTGDTAGRIQTRKDTVDLITSTETSLNSIKRPLNAQEQETANQIKTFLSKATLALKNDDLDGALILATKAKVLLDELNKT